MQLPSVEQRAFFESAASQYQRDLAADTSAQAYLRSRGIGPEAAGTFRLGVLRNPLPGHEQFRGRLSIPYITPGGVVTFSFRCLENHVCKETVLWVDDKGKEHKCRKYRAPEGIERTLYNVPDFRKDGQEIYVCEGEIDTLTLSLCGYAAIGVPGVQNWKPQYTLCFADYTDGGQVFCVADGDEAGRKMAAFLAVELKARVVRPARGMDVNSIYVQGGINAVRRWLDGATAR